MFFRHLAVIAIVMTVLSVDNSQSLALKSHKEVRKPTHGSPHGSQEGGHLNADTGDTYGAESKGSGSGDSRNGGEEGSLSELGPLSGGPFGIGADELPDVASSSDTEFSSEHDNTGDDNKGSQRICSLHQPKMIHASEKINNLLEKTCTQLHGATGYSDGQSGASYRIKGDDEGGNEGQLIGSSDSKGSLSNSIHPDQYGSEYSGD